MFSNTLLKITTKNQNNKFIKTDNLDTYLNISDFKNNFDGLFFNGFYLFNSLSIENTKNIESKTLSPANIQLTLSNKILITFTLLKNNNGIIINLNDKKIIPKINKNYNITLESNENFQILEKNIKNIILEYSKPNKKTFCAIALNINYEFENVIQTNNKISFLLKPISKTTKNPEFYIFYHENYDNLKNILEINTNNINNLKTEHIANSLFPLKYINFHSDEKTVNNALFWSILTSYNFIYNRDKKYGIIPGTTENFDFQTINTFISTPGITLVTGLYKITKNILFSISKSQCKKQSTEDYGKIPDFISTRKKPTFTLSNPTPLFIRSIYEYFLYTGDYKFIISLWENIKLAIDNVYMLKKDSNNLLKQPETNKKDKSDENKNCLYLSREGCPVETQALWYTALSCASFIANKISKYENKQKNKNNKIISELLKKSIKYKEEAKKIKISFNKHFISKNPPYIFDNFDKSNLSLNKNSILYSMLAIYYSSLPGIPILIDKKTGLNLIIGIISFLEFDQSKKDSNDYNKKIMLLFSAKLISAACKYGLLNSLNKYSIFFTKQILGNNISELQSDTTLSSQNIFSCSSLIAEYIRSFYQDILGIKMFVPERKIFLTPCIPEKLNNISYNVRFGYKESLSSYIRLSKKSLNISYIEIKGLKIIKPVLIFLKIHLGFEQKNDKYKYKQIILKIKFSKSDDLIRISFDSAKLNLIKLKDLNMIGSSIIYGIKHKTEIFDKKIE